MGLINRLKTAWNVFNNRDPTLGYYTGMGSSFRPDRIRYSRKNDRTIATAVYNRISMDAAAIAIKHVQLDETGRYLKDIPSHLNACLNLEANIDQTGRAFLHDAVSSMLDEGCVALVPTDRDDEADADSTGILTMRTGKVVEWGPSHVRICLYNEQTGRHEEITLSKDQVAIIENPLYPVINEPNSTMQRLIRKLNLLDAVDEQSSSGKLDLIIQLPYTVKSPLRKAQADERVQSIEHQLAGSKYGIAYADATEKITQLNRSVDNNLMKQVEYLTSMLYSQLGITQAILDGTADDQTMLNYYNRTIEPILSAIIGEMERKFLTQNARANRQAIRFFRDPFKLVPVNDLAEIADKFTRNAIMSPNEIRQLVGMRPSEDPESDRLRNRNLNESTGEDNAPSVGAKEEPTQNGD